MSAHASSDTPIKRVRLPELKKAKREGRKLTMLTAYDSLVASILDSAGIDMLLIGDSIGNVSLGYPNTLSVSLEDIERATAAVARGSKRAFIVADLPFGSFEASPEQALEASIRLLKAGAHGIKLEGGQNRAETVKVLTSNGIPVMGHLGYTPQSEHSLGGPRMQGRGSGAARMLDDALALSEAGVFAIVLEMVPASLGASLTAKLRVPTIGIGAGPHCDGQVLVWADMAGMTEWTPSFVHRFAEIGQELKNAASAYIHAVNNEEFPTPANYRDE